MLKVKLDRQSAGGRRCCAAGNAGFLGGIVRLRRSQSFLCLMRRQIMAQNNKGRFDSFGEVLLTSFFDHGSHAIITQQPLPGSSRRGPGSSLFCVDRQQPCLAFAFGSSTAPPGAARDPPVRPRYCDCRSAGERQGHPMRAHRRRLWGRAPLHG